MEALTQNPLPFLVNDIETDTPDRTALEQAIEAWKPPSNIKDPAKIAERREEAWIRIREKAALLDAAPLLCTGAATPDQVILFSGMRGSPSIEHAQVIQCQEERTQLYALGTWLDAATSHQTVLTGFNILSWDLPKLRCAFLRHRLPLPRCLIPREGNQPVYDIMRQFCRYYSADLHDEHRVSLDEVQRRLGLPPAQAHLQCQHGPRARGTRGIRDDPDLLRDRHAHRARGLSTNDRRQS